MRKPLATANALIKADRIWPKKPLHMTDIQEAVLKYLKGSCLAIQKIMHHRQNSQDSLITSSKRSAFCHPINDIGALAGSNWFPQTAPTR